APAPASAIGRRPPKRNRAGWVGSYAERKAAAGGRDQHLVAHLCGRLLHEVEPGAVHRDHYVGVELLDLGDDLGEVILRRRPEMEAADDRVHLLDARDLLRLLDRIDDADMAAGRDHDEAEVAHVEA